MPLVPDTARWACLYNTRGAKARSGGVRVGFKCSLVRGNKRRCARMALGISPPPSVALLLLSGFTTPTLGGGSDGLATRPPAAEKPHRAKNSIQTLLFHDSILPATFLGNSVPMESNREKCVAPSDHTSSHILISECVN